MSESLAIIGISCLFPKADDLQSYWRNIKQGVDAIAPIPLSHWSAADYFNADPKAPDQTYAQRVAHIQGPTTGSIELAIPEIHVDLKPVEKTVKGERCSILIILIHLLVDFSYWMCTRDDILGYNILIVDLFF